MITERKLSAGGAAAPRAEARREGARGPPTHADIV